MNTANSASHPTPDCERCPTRKHALFGTLQGETLRQAAALRCGSLSLLPGETLPVGNQDHQGDVIYTLFDGWMTQGLASDHPKGHLVDVALPGDVLGFGKGQSHNQPLIRAITPCQLCILPQDALLAEGALLHRLVDKLTEQLNRSHQLLRSVAHANAEERLCHLALMLFQRCQQRRMNHQQSIPFPLTQEDMGGLLGLTPVHVSRTLKGLRLQGVMQIRHRWLTIIDKAAMERLANRFPFSAPQTRSRAELVE